MKPLRLLYLFVLSGAVISATGCDSDRISKLEKENQEMKAKLEKGNAAQDYELQARCAKDTRVWFNQTYSPQPDTDLLAYTNHYNKNLNKCFATVEIRFRTVTTYPLWGHIITLWDVYENSHYGTYSELLTDGLRLKGGTADNLLHCEVYGSKCKTIDEYNGLVQPYLNN